MSMMYSDLYVSRHPLKSSEWHGLVNADPRSLGRCCDDIEDLRKAVVALRSEGFTGFSSRAFLYRYARCAKTHNMNPGKELLKLKEYCIETLKEK